ncbi:hypothetical protein COLO4_34233 [Corchorus olitorius]|uniref:Uncharacterized protein n=1 Tax=Corchorus olitorius TaxID=93759 RepID=A0A1R3GMZ3_9ROSI|nr:hypothetical protein COLO4_34233 [Corchorus olitorius]
MKERKKVLSLLKRLSLNSSYVEVSTVMLPDSLLPWQIQMDVEKLEYKTDECLPPSLKMPEIQKWVRQSESSPPSWRLTSRLALWTRSCNWDVSGSLPASENGYGAVPGVGDQLVISGSRSALKAIPEHDSLTRLCLLLVLMLRVMKDLEFRGWLGCFLCRLVNQELDYPTQQLRMKASSVTRRKEQENLFHLQKPLFLILDSTQAKKEPELELAGKEAEAEAIPSKPKKTARIRRNSKQKKGNSLLAIRLALGTEEIDSPPVPDRQGKGYLELGALRKEAGLNTLSILGPTIDRAFSLEAHLSSSDSSPRPMLDVRPYPFDTACYGDCQLCILA